ncbi:MAG: hypothetical protein O3C29_03820 [Proteobacteria bacterium]|nr:hypothetical protein [Pseudomonadota bacterium]MDA1291198.1 hypothetical protein [Pseudomonadota bacterium]
MLIEIIGGFDEGDSSFVEYMTGIVYGTYPADTATIRDAIWQFWMLYENDFLQYKLGLMDAEIWDAKLKAMLAMYNTYKYRDITDLVLGFSTNELSELLIELSEIKCP